MRNSPSDSALVSSAASTLRQNQPVGLFEGDTFFTTEFTAELAPAEHVDGDVVVAHDDRVAREPAVLEVVAQPKAQVLAGTRARNVPGNSKGAEPAHADRQLRRVRRTEPVARDELEVGGRDR